MFPKDFLVARANGWVLVRANANPWEQALLLKAVGRKREGEKRSHRKVRTSGKISSASVFKSLDPQKVRAAAQIAANAFFNGNGRRPHRRRLETDHHHATLEQRPRSVQRVVKNVLLTFSIKPNVTSAPKDELCSPTRNWLRSIRPLGSVYIHFIEYAHYRANKEHNRMTKEQTCES